MISLLEKKDKDFVRAEQTKRLLVIALQLFSSLLIFILIGTSAFYGALLIERQSLESSRAILQGGKAGEAKAFLAEIKEANLLLARLSSERNNLRSVTPILEKIDRDRPAGINLTSISLVSGEGNATTIKLVGTYAYRKDILNFTESLKKNDSFTGVESPFSNLIKEKNSEFSVSLTLAKEKK